jgi:chemotaxis protein methyltransferase CheR
MATTTGAEISRDNYVFLQQHVYQTSGIVLDDNKHYLLEARLLPIVRKEELKTLNDLCALLRASGTGRVFQEVRDAMTTNETLFFRDAVPFKAIGQVLLPELLQRRAGSGSSRVSFWSAAASSGQEAYSLAMMLLDMGIKAADIEILATDISDKVLEQAFSGRYSQTEVGRGLPAQQLVRYFQRDRAEWQIKDEVRRLVRFQPFDLRDRMNSIGRFDFVLCRNVLIYFDMETKKRILREMESTLNPQGFLLLGAAETTLNLTDAFERRAIDAVSFYQKR